MTNYIDQHTREKCSHVRYVINAIYTSGTLTRVAEDLCANGVYPSDKGCWGCGATLPVALLHIITDFLTCKTEDWDYFDIDIIEGYLAAEVLPVVMAGLSHPFLDYLSRVKRRLGYGV